MRQVIVKEMGVLQNTLTLLTKTARRCGGMRAKFSICVGIYTILSLHISIVPDNVGRAAYQLCRSVVREAYIIDQAYLISN